MTIRVGDEQALLVQRHCCEAADGFCGSPFVLRDSQCMSGSDWFKGPETGQQVYMNLGIFDKQNAMVEL